MPGEIDFTTGRPAIAYVGEKPWHGFGENMKEDQPLDEWRVAAGLDWKVKEQQLFTSPYAAEGPRLKPVPNRVALYRTDTNDILSVVSDRFKIVQPREVIEFFNTLIEKNGFKMETAGSLRGGKRIWALARTGKDFSIHGDKLDAFLMLATAFDGTFSTTAQFTSVRVVCNNTLEISLDRPSERCVKIPHNQEFLPFNVKAELGLDESWNRFRDNVLRFSEYKITKREAIDYFLTVLGVTEEEAADGKQLSNVKKLIEIYENGPGADLRTAKNTLWGAVNAVTYLTDHARRAKDNGTRFDSASFGSGAVMKKTAFDTALTLVEAA